jgi:hypothetical protein
MVWNGRKGVNQLPITWSGSISKRRRERMCFGHFGQSWCDSASGELRDKKEIHLWSKITGTSLKTDSLTRWTYFFQRTLDKKCTKSICPNLNCSREVKLIAYSAISNWIIKWFVHFSQIVQFRSLAKASTIILNVGLIFFGLIVRNNCSEFKGYLEFRGCNKTLYIDVPGGAAAVSCLDIIKSTHNMICKFDY